MTNTGKIQAIRSVLLLNDPDKSQYIKLLEDLGDLLRAGSSGSGADEGCFWSVLQIRAAEYR